MSGSGSSSHGVVGARGRAAAAAAAAAGDWAAWSFEDACHFAQYFRHFAGNQHDQLRGQRCSSGKEGRIK